MEWMMGKCFAGTSLASVCNNSASLARHIYSYFMMCCGVHACCCRADAKDNPGSLSSSVWPRRPLSLFLLLSSFLDSFNCFPGEAHLERFVPTWTLPPLEFTSPRRGNLHAVPIPFPSPELCDLGVKIRWQLSGSQTLLMSAISSSPKQ